MNGEELKREIRDAYYNDDMYSRYDLVEAVEDIVDDNAKLRELVKALLQCHVEDTATCAKCSCRSPLHGGCMADVNADELGVEVDG